MEILRTGMGQMEINKAESCRILGHPSVPVTLALAGWWPFICQDWGMGVRCGAALALYGR
ncbi:MAG: hypothetical protein JKY57_06515 [Kordiimonadaceae bacterium]|nr:hypothetical protein [Kordiimonadaceae bacterium]